MAKMSKAQKKRAFVAMLQKAEKLYLNEALDVKDVGVIMGIKQRGSKRLGYDPRAR